MKQLSVFLLSALLLSGGVAGCYDDKGNYDYREINEMKVSISAKTPEGRDMPIGEDGSCRYKQSSSDTLTVIYTPVVVQSLAPDGQNLEYLWEVSAGETTDSVCTKELTLKFPPRETSVYHVVFRVTDRSTRVSFYSSLHVMTVKPYMNAWLVLNGPAGDRRISAVENPDSTDWVFTENAYTDLGYAPRFSHAKALIYSSDFHRRTRDEQEALQIMQDDSLTLVYPFDMKELKSSREFLPSKIVNENRKLGFGLSGGPRRMSTLIVDDRRRLYYAGGNYEEKYEEVNSDNVANYRVDKIGFGCQSDYVSFWDREQAKFMYVSLGGSVEAFGTGNEWAEKEVVWMGEDNRNDKNAMGMAIVKDVQKKTYGLYHFTADGFEIKGEELGAMPFEAASCFVASAVAFPEQFFYTVGSKLFRFVVASRESVELYDAGAAVTRLQFRLDQEHNLDKEYTEVYRCLAVVVDKGGKGELHEIHLNTAGDVASVQKFGGFGPIQDICFTFINRIIR